MKHLVSFRLRSRPFALRAAVTSGNRSVQSGAERSTKDVKVGFRWNPAMNRWKRDDRVAGQVDQPVMVQPKSGPAYTVLGSGSCPPLAECHSDACALAASTADIAVMMTGDLRKAYAPTVRGTAPRTRVQVPEAELVRARAPCLAV
jgi:hypothetical protein